MLFVWHHFVLILYGQYRIFHHFVHNNCRRRGGRKITEKEEQEHNMAAMKDDRVSIHMQQLNIIFIFFQSIL